MADFITAKKYPLPKDRSISEEKKMKEVTVTIFGNRGSMVSIGCS